jgi:anthranilate synthase component 1
METTRPVALATKSLFCNMVQKAKEYVRDGDIIQVVLSNRYEGKTGYSGFQIYRALRLINPSPYMYYFRFGENAIVGSSPETLVRLENRKIDLRPIAGTRPRGENEKKDRKLELELLADPKEFAEHVMLVDLGRNDVGRVAEKATVRVTDFKTIERYSHVMHLVSHVQGILREGLDGFDLLKATFPAGTLSGAPKIRAMEIIEELETRRRGPYGGALGYFSFSGNMDFCITIRTLLLSKKKYTLQAGAGIVADSIAEHEYQECENKAKAVLKALDLAKDMET